MEFRTDEPGVRDNAALTATGSQHFEEVDLYAELASFSELPPEAQREELERLERANAQAAPPAHQPPPVSFDFIERGDVPTLATDKLNSSPEPIFNLIDESQVEPLEQPPAAASAVQVFSFLEESAPEPSESSRASSHSDHSLRVTSPLEDICSDALLLPQPNMKCNCGAALATEDLFCPSCGQLLDEALS